MKKTLKLAGLLLALVMVISALPVMASADPTYSITVNAPSAAQDGETYHAWQILSIESKTGSTDDGDLATATYKVGADWKDFFTTGAGAAYFDVSTDGLDYVTLKKNTDGESIVPTDAQMAALAKAALAYADTNSITTTLTADTVSDVAEITVPSDGWYLVDSSVGTICMITNAASNVTINDKNTVPTISKTVANTTKSFAADEDNTASVGDVMTYTVVISAKPGATKYVFHDVMDAGLTYNNDVAVSVGGAALADTNYSLTTATDDTLTVTFTQAYLDTITAATDITITYTATVNAAAIEDADSKVDNKAKLNYGDDSYTETDTATVYTYGFDLAKYDGNTDKVIDGATFSLWTDATTGTEIALYYDSANGYYRPAVGSETASDIAVGVAKIEGLADGTYYLQEENFPAGYNKLASRVAVTIDGDDVFFTANAPAAVDADVSDTEGGVLVENKQGELLPTTGGMGTTILYVIGAILVIGAGVVLVSKKRMGAAK